jgi:hypothetical protein
MSHETQNKGHETAPEIRNREMAMASMAMRNGGRGEGPAGPLTGKALPLAYCLLPATAYWQRREQLAIISGGGFV